MSTSRSTPTFDEALVALDRAVAEAVAFFRQADDALADGHQTAREVISHLVFWHREYVKVARALVAGRQPRLLSGVFRHFNAMAAREFAGEPLPLLAERLARLQRQLEAALRQLTDLKADFPIKQGGQYWSVEDRIPAIESHIRNHVSRLKRAGATAAATSVGGVSLRRSTGESG